MITSPSIDQLEHHIKRLRTASATERVFLYRLIMDAAWEAHMMELRQIDAINSVFADPNITSAVGDFVL